MRALLLLFTLPVLAADWHGYVRRDVEIDGVKGYVVEPRIAAPGKPWLWRARFPEFHPEAAEALLGKGFHLAYLDLPNIFGSPKAMDAWDRFYDRATREFGLAPKMTLEGVSRGGLFVYNWALRHPGKVNAIYCESPVLDMKSWPGGRGKGIGSPADWTQALASFGFSEEQMLAHRGNPLDQAAALAAHRIPALHIVCERDRVVPPAENTLPFADRYRRAGASIVVHHNTRQPETSNSHHFPLDDPAIVVNFVLRHTPGMERLAGTGMTPHGVEYHQIRDGLRNSLAKFSRGGEARVAFLGGSITEGKGWRDMVCDHLRRRFPATKFDCVNAGIGSTGSTPGAFRLERDVFSRGPVDLLFEEAAVNDASNGFTAREQVRGMEGIVRHARSMNPAIDVVLLHFVDPDKMTDYRAGRTPEVIRSHESVAAHYGLPSIDLAREVTERIDAGEFTWDGDFKNLHPSPFGQTVYMRSIQRMFDAAWRDPAGSGAVPLARALPDPLDEQSYSRGRLLDPGEAKCGEGWRVDVAGRPNDRAATRPRFTDVPMLVGERPAGECKLSFDGRAVGVFVTAGPDAGVFEFSIDGGPFRRQDQFTKWSERLHIPWTYVFDGDLAPGRHELRLRIAPGERRSARILHWLVN